MQQKMESLKNSSSVIQCFHSKAKLKGQILISICIKHFSWKNKWIILISNICTKGTWHINEVAVIEVALQIIQKSTPILLSSIIYQTILVMCLKTGIPLFCSFTTPEEKIMQLLNCNSFPKKRLKQFLLGLKETCGSRKKVSNM